MGVAEVDNLEKYKSYIQRRRVEAAPKEKGLSQETALEKTEISVPYAMNFSGDTGSEEKAKSKEEGQAGYTESSSDSAESFTPYHYGSESSWDTRNDSGKTRTSTNFRRTDPNLYRRLYGKDHKSTRTGYLSGYHGSTVGNPADTADNRTAVLAIKIIKQALACFVVLGIIVLMQQRSDMAGALAFVKKYVVDSHTDPQNLLTGVENIIKECSRLLGGSP